MSKLVPALTVAVLAGLAVPNIHAAKPEADARSADPSHIGSYRFSFFGKDLGDETFTIRETEDGYRIDARLYLDVKGQVPSESIYLLDRDRRLVSATYRELVQDGASAEYRIEDGNLIATGVGGSASGERVIQLEPGAVVTGPHYVTDFFVLDPLELSVGESHEQVAYTFGFQGWEPCRVKFQSKREKNKTLKLPSGDRIDATVYRCTIETENKTFRTRSWINEAGVSARITVDAMIGSLDARMHELAANSPVAN